MILENVKQMLIRGNTKDRITKQQSQLISNKTTYHFIIASDKFLLINEPLEEILRERVQHYQREKKPIDFWLIKSPRFLQSEKLTSIREKLSESNLLEQCSTIVSLDKNFIVWLKLRLNNVITGNFEAPSDDIPSPLASTLN